MLSSIRQWTLLCNVFLQLFRSWSHTSVSPTSNRDGHRPPDADCCRLVPMIGRTGQRPNDSRFELAFVALGVLLRPDGQSLVWGREQSRMELATTDAFVGLECVDCDATYDADETNRCPDCGDSRAELRLRRDRPRAGGSRVAVVRLDVALRGTAPFLRKRPLRPTRATPLVECPTLAEELGVGRLLIKDEGRNPTGTIRDRGQSVAVTAVAGRGGTDVALASTGDGGQSAAAYAGRAGLESHVYLPRALASRTRRW